MESRWLVPSDEFKKLVDGSCSSIKLPFSIDKLGYGPMWSGVSGKFKEPESTQTTKDCDPALNDFCSELNTVTFTCWIAAVLGLTALLTRTSYFCCSKGCCCCGPAKQSAPAAGGIGLTTLILLSIAIGTWNDSRQSLGTRVVLGWCYGGTRVALGWH